MWLHICMAGRMMAYNVTSHLCWLPNGMATHNFCLLILSAIPYFTIFGSDYDTVLLRRAIDCKSLWFFGNADALYCPHCVFRCRLRLVWPRLLKRSFYFFIHSRPVQKISCLSDILLHLWRLITAGWLLWTLISNHSDPYNCCFIALQHMWCRMFCKQNK